MLNGKAIYPEIIDHMGCDVIYRRTSIAIFFEAEHKEQVCYTEQHKCSNRGDEMGKKQKPRSFYKYQFKVGNKIVHGGTTKDLERREQEHQQKPGWGGGHIKKVGRITTEEAAREWEKKKGHS
ncbi:MAG: hypothetical protein ACC700_12215 [Anaerolineales bacterium]